MSNPLDASGPELVACAKATDTCDRHLHRERRAGVRIVRLVEKSCQPGNGDDTAARRVNQGEMSVRTSGLRDMCAHVTVCHIMRVCSQAHSSTIGGKCEQVVEKLTQ